MDSDILSGLGVESKRIFSMILRRGALTKGELAQLSGLKLTTLKRMMQPLEDLNLIVEADIGESTGGRKPVLYDVNPQKYYVVGLDISRMYTQAVLTNLKMVPVETYRFEMHQELNPQRTLQLIQDWFMDVSQKLMSSNGLIIGIGLGTVGPLDRSNGLILNPANFAAEGWENIPLRSLLEERLGLPVLIDNGANAAVLAEACYGIGKGIKNIMYLNCGIGIRTGVISSGAFVRTINDTEDAFAHMVIDVEGKDCSCGNCGCIEQYSSITAITREFLAELKKGQVSIVVKPVQKITYLDICKAAEANDLLARKVLQNAAGIMGTGLANFIKLLNPGLVVLSGPLIKHSKLFYLECVETALQKSFGNTDKNIIFSRGGYFSENAISIGSAAMVLENYLDKDGLS